MDVNIPSAAQVRAALVAVPFGDLEALATRSGVPLTTLIKIRNGETENPRIETVRGVWPHLPAGQAAA